MSSLEDICLCEFGFRVGDGRTDSNKCPVHDMTHAELLEYAATGWREVIALGNDLTKTRGLLRRGLAFGHTKAAAVWAADVREWLYPSPVAEKAQDDE